ncbi:polysaccharide biosynthesis protein [Candidatus Methylopumilus universalis]|uniref:polysaccharide biosynthesis protein n=1 Tax=Candidatus Methylopumilus universalis TaxID=2588536 RepID=UPI00111F6594|nr:nucleoside-diphosphate sugar epimerase/dehydratase [Candidatus Methylopumilus universalis]QDC97802.1 polysaccharide biosynthesis protein [Candidatus Methylopumilus universalis]
MKNIKIFLAFLHDFFAIIFSWFLAYALRFNFAIPDEHLQVLYRTLPAILLISSCCFYFIGLYRGIWRFASITDLKRIIVSTLIAICISIAFFLMHTGYSIIPRSILVMYPLLLILMMGWSRLTYRTIKEHQLYGLKASMGEPVIIIGSGQNAILIAKELNLSIDWRVIGILNDYEGMHRRELDGIRILGSINQLSQLKERFNIRKVIIASAELTDSQRREVIKIASNLNIEVLTVPLMGDLVSGRLKISQIRPVEVEDLLGRDKIDLDNSGLKKLIKNKTILISGAGGSIGSELCRQIIKFNPKKLICLDISEIALYKIEQEFLNLKFKNNIYVVADVKNKERLRELFNHFKPEIIFHAAAYKHVPLMETYNVSEALINNAIGTYHLAQIAKDFKANKFILVSTDKAVNPTNVMGASKNLAEVICRGLQLRSKTDFVITRFGNVLGSSGSVIPKFREQIALGGPVTVTHPEMTRFFMSIPEAAQLVIQASLMGKGGQIFLLDMGEPVKITNLAKDMIKLSGFNEIDIKIKFTGLRPGEKIYEELLSEGEVIMPTTHPKLKIASSRNISEKTVKDLIEWVLSTTSKTEVQIKKELKRWVKGYSVKDKRTGPTKA